MIRARLRAQLSFFKAKGLKVAQLALPTAPKGILDTLGADDDDGLPGRGIGDADLPSSDEEDEDFEARISRTIIPYYSPVRLSLMIASAAGCACAAQGGGAGSDGGSPSDSSSESEEEEGGGGEAAKPKKKRAKKEKGGDGDGDGGGKAGGRKKRAKKDKDAPKGAVTAFFFFSNAERPKARVLLPSPLISFKHATAAAERRARARRVLGSGCGAASPHTELAPPLCVWAGRCARRTRACRSRTSAASWARGGRR